jgi:HEPN domain-containing protein
MNALTLEWVEKAEGDYVTAGRELRARRRPNYDATCFHAQQTAEKYLKAFLHERGMVPPRTHSLIMLLEWCLPHDVGIEFLRNPLIRLDRYAVRFRYPGESADKDEARHAFQAITLVRQFMRARLGLVTEAPR